MPFRPGELGHGIRGKCKFCRSNRVRPPVVFFPQVEDAVPLGETLTGGAKTKSTSRPARTVGTVGTVVPEADNKRKKRKKRKRPKIDNSQQRDNSLQTRSVVKKKECPVCLRLYEGEECEYSRCKEEREVARRLFMDYVNITTKAEKTVSCAQCGEKNIINMIQHGDSVNCTNCNNSLMAKCDECGDTYNPKICSSICMKVKNINKWVCPCWTHDYPQKIQATRGENRGMLDGPQCGQINDITNEPCFMERNQTSRI